MCAGSFAYIGADTAVLETNFQEGEFPGHRMQVFHTLCGVPSDVLSRLLSPHTGQKSIFKGILCGLAWKGMETWMQISLRTKWMVRLISVHSSST